LQVRQAGRSTAWFAGLRRDDLPLDERPQLLRFGKCQTQVGDILKTIGSIELHDVHADRWDTGEHPQCCA
jgi:hypothetical protein